MSVCICILLSFMHSKCWFMGFYPQLSSLLNTETFYKSSSSLRISGIPRSIPWSYIPISKWNSLPSFSLKYCGLGKSSLGANLKARRVISLQAGYREPFPSNSPPHPTHSHPPPAATHYHSQGGVRQVEWKKRWGRTNQLRQKCW